MASQRALFYRPSLPRIFAQIVLANGDAVLHSMGTIFMEKLHFCRRNVGVRQSARNLVEGGHRRRKYKQVAGQKAPLNGLCTDVHAELLRTG